MREAAEPLDDVGMQIGELGNGLEGLFVGWRYRLGETLIDLARLFLHFARFCVLRGHVKEGLVDRSQAVVLFLHRAFYAKLESRLVLLECFGGVAKDIPPQYTWAAFVVGLTVAAILLTGRYVRLSREHLR